MITFKKYNNYLLKCLKEIGTTRKTIYTISSWWWI